MSVLERLDRRSVVNALARNAVSEQQRRIAAEFEVTAARGQTQQLAALGPFAAMLCEILTCVDWQGKQNRILEALPHIDPIASVRTMRAVLARLDVNLVRIDRRAPDLTKEDLPCLLVGGMDECALVTLGSRNEFETYRLNGVRTDVLRFGSAETIYLIRSGETEIVNLAVSGSGFVGTVLKQLRGPLLYIAGHSVIINVLGLMLSMYVVEVYDIVIATSSLDTLAFLASGALAALALELWIRQLRSKAIAYLAARLDAVVATRALTSLLNLPLAMTERAPIASQLSRFRQFEIGRELFAGNFASALFDLPFTLTFLLLLFYFGGSLGLVPIGLSVIMVVVCVVGATLTAEQSTKVGVHKLRSDALLFELTDKLRTIRNASAETIWLARYATSLATYLRSRVRILQLTSLLQAVTNALVALAGILTLGVGAESVMNGTMSIGALVASMMIVWRVLVPIQIFSLNIARLKQTVSTVRQINDLVRMGTDRASEVPPILSRQLGGHILATGLYLSLTPQQEPQLRGVNLEVKVGEIVAITGPSGSGKSTLLKVLVGLYPQYMGTIRLGGLDLRQLHPAEARASIGFASQQLAFFYGSIAANFRFASPDATDADIITALAAVGVLLPNPGLPQGLATRISGTHARSLSQGRLCRLSIARALVKKPNILLLDYPANGLDRVADAALMSCLGTLRGKCTVLWITAQPSHMRMADRVVEMRGGVIVANGRPDTVVSRLMAGSTTAA